MRKGVTRGSLFIQLTIFYINIHCNFRRNVYSIYRPTTTEHSCKDRERERENRITHEQSSLRFALDNRRKKQNKFTMTRDPIRVLLCSYTEG